MKRLFLKSEKMKVVLLFLSVSLFVFAGCGGKEQSCKGVTPWASNTILMWEAGDPNADSLFYAADATDFNSVYDVTEFLNCHDSTLLENYRNYIPICGFLVDFDTFPIDEYPDTRIVRSYLVDDTNAYDEKHRVDIQYYIKNDGSLPAYLSGEIIPGEKYYLLTMLWTLDPNMYDNREELPTLYSSSDSCCPWFYHLLLLKIKDSI